MNNLLSLEDFINEKKVFHGGANNFNKFDTSFMGTGEGAQIYGWGVYLTESESLGEFYIRNAIINNAQRGERESLKNWFRKNNEKAIINKTIYTPDDDGNIYGYLYASDIPDDNGENYIDWNLNDHDKLVKIYEKIKSKLNNKQRNFIEEELKDKSYKGYNPIKKIKSIWKHYFNEITNFSRLYSDLSYILGTPKDASTLLNNSGYVGIKVPMDNRRNKKSVEGYNYIIFNTDNIIITSKRKITYNDNINRDGGSLKYKNIKNITELPIE